MAYISGMESDKANLQWAICLVEIALSKGVEHIIEVTMTLQKILNFVFGRFKDF